MYFVHTRFLRSSCIVGSVFSGEVPNRQLVFACIMFLASTPSWVNLFLFSEICAIPNECFFGDKNMSYRS